MSGKITGGYVGACWWVALVAGLCACSDTGRTTAPAVDSSISGTVVAANATADTLTLAGTGLPNSDPNGNLTVAVGAGDAAIGYVGRTVRGDLSQDHGKAHLDNIWPADDASTAVVNEAARRLGRDTLELGRDAFRDVGDSIPDFALYNENGEVVQSASLRGRRLVINFVFTRCANPDMCPASTHRMAELQKALKAANISDVTLVTLTFDPEHDTPGALREYAQAYGLDFSNFQLLTGPDGEIADLLKQFGILVKHTDTGALQHTMATILVSPEGRVLYRRDGSSWTPQDFLDRLAPPAQDTVKS